MIAFLRKQRWKICAAVVALGTLLLLYAGLIERTWIEETEVAVSCPGWESETPLRFAVLADIHAKSIDGAYLDDIVSRTLAGKPDAVLLLGDYLRGHKKGQGMPLDELESHLKPLVEAGLPLFAVLGNHDYYHGEEEIRAMLEHLGAHIVLGEADNPVRFEKHGAKMDIGGIRCLYYYKQPDFVPSPKDGVPLLLLSHTPVGAKYAAPGTFLVIAGHTHGGQVRWPWGSPIKMADGKTPREYSSSMVNVEGQRCYVSRGLGTSLLPIRFACRPELTFVTVSR